ncbi:MAG: InlB B-repeat-containing protein [Lachnospiraceae bacterium]|nr:InlB B-repeat-containing protein [Lachnospiraceae bacterium]
MKKNIIAKLAAASLGLFILTAGTGFAKAEAARAAEDDKASGITEYADEDPAEDVFDEPGVVEYDLWVGDVQVTSENCGNLKSALNGTGDYGASYDPATKTLTFTGDVTGVDGSHMGYLIYSDDDLTIKGNASLDSPAHSIFSKGVLTIDGNFLGETMFGVIRSESDIIVNGYLKGNASDYGQVAVSCEGSITVNGKIDVTTSGEYSSAINAKGGISFPTSNSITKPEEYEKRQDDDGYWSVCVPNDSDGYIKAKAVVIEPDYELWVAGKKVAFENKDDVLGDGTVKYDPDNNVLSFKNAELTTEKEVGDKENCRVYNEIDGLTITGTANISGEECAVYSGVSKRLIFDGEETKLTLSGVTNGINANDANVEFKGGEISLSGTGTEGVAMNTDSATITGGKISLHSNNEQALLANSVTISGGEINTESNTEAAILVDNLNVKGGSLKAESISLSEGNSAIIASKSFTVSAGKVEAVACNEGGQSTAGIYSKSITLSGGSVYTESRGISGRGVFIPGAGTLTVNGGSVTATSTGDSGDGIYGDGNATINLNGGIVNASSDNTGYGIYGDDNTAINLNGGKISASSASGAIKTGGSITLGKRMRITKPDGGKLADNNKSIVTSSGGTAAEVDVRQACTITFDLNGKTGTAPAQQIKDFGMTLDTVEDPSADGYTFTGWYTAATCKTDEKFEFTDESKATGDLTLYAGWKAVNRTVTFDLNGKEGTAPTAQTVENGKTASEPSTAPTVEGFDFTGWYKEKECTSKYDFATPVTGNLTLYAGWKGVNRTVTFDLNGKEGTAPAAQTVKNGKTASEPSTAPTVEGFDFTGWYKEKECTSRYDFATPVTGNLTLYAGWKEAGAPGDDPDTPVTPEPVTPEPVTPDPVTPAPVTPEPAAPAPVEETKTINGASVKAEVKVTYPQAVTWTGKPTAKGQLQMINGKSKTDAVTFAIAGLEQAFPNMKKGTDTSKLVKISYKIKDATDIGTGKAYFTISLTLDKKALKKARIKGSNKKQLQEFIANLNKKLADDKHYFEIAPINLADANVTIKAKLKKKKVQVNEDGTIKGLSSVTIKVNIPGIKKPKTYTFKASKAKNLFVITASPDTKTARLTVKDPASGFAGTKEGITVKKK